MTRYSTGDPWTDAKLLHAEERMAEARAHAVRRTLLRDAEPPPRRGGLRLWLGSLLIAAGYRLLGAAARSAEHTT